MTYNPKLQAPGPTLETERLILRPPAAEDFEGWADFGADPVAMEFLGGSQPRSVMWRNFAAMAGSWSVLGFGMFSIIEKSSGLWVGRLGPWMPEGWPGTEVGYGLSRSAWRKGYAKEGCVAAINWAFEELGWSEVIHTIAPTNIASQGVAKSLGSVNRGSGKLPAPYEMEAIEIWGQTREEWFSLR